MLSSHRVTQTKDTTVGLTATTGDAAVSCAWEQHAGDRLLPFPPIPEPRFYL